jgi:simple sugar transport system substrate-binding protein
MSKHGVRFLIVFAVLTIAAGIFVAHGGLAAERGTPPKVGGAGMGYKFVLVNHGSSGDPYHAVVKKGMEDAARVYGVKAEMVFSEGDTAKLVDQLDQAIAGNPDGVGITITDEVAFDDVIKKAIDRGIPVIAFNMDDAETSNARLAYIGADERKVGYTIGKYMQRFFKKGDHIVIPEEFPGMTYAVFRSAGIKKAMDEIGVTYEELDAGVEKAECSRRVSAYLMGHPETDGIIGVGGITTEVSSMVVEDMKLKDKVVVAGFDLLPGTASGIKKGITKGTIDQQPYLQGYLCVVELALIKFGKFSAIDVDTGRGIVTQNNVDEVLELVKMKIR